MKIGEMMPSKYLKQSDIGEDPKLVTFKKFTTADVSQDQSGDMKWIAHFEELDKPLVMNVTNLKRAAKAFGTDETDEWIGKKIVIYVDPDIEFGGEIVGGIRLRAPKNAKGSPAAAPKKPEPTGRRAAATAEAEAAAAEGAFKDDFDGEELPPF